MASSAEASAEASVEATDTALSQADVSPMTAYAVGLALAHRRQAGSGAYRLRCDDGSMQSIPLERWTASASAADRRLLATLSGPVIDLGCGPGRHLHALQQLGVGALGVDISPAAVLLARAGGADAIRASIFDALPNTGQWSSALLLDGNIGIGADPNRLLSRVGELLRPGGVVLVELDVPGSTSRALRARLEGPGVSSSWFRWSRTGVDAIGSLARNAGLEPGAPWQDEGRWFAQLFLPEGRARTTRGPHYPSR